jgi:branched-chain amino acid transport system substrate-binding protein
MAALEKPGKPLAGSARYHELNAVLVGGAPRNVEVGAETFRARWTELTRAQMGAHHPSMRRVAAAVFVLLAVGAGCGGEDAAEPVAASSCAQLLYEGKGEPDVIVVSDFPRRGIAAEFTTLDVEAIKFVLKQRDYRAGDLRIGYQSCNDTVGDEPYDSGVCERNAKAYVAAKDVIGVIGPFNSGCAALQIPILSRKAAGPLAMISPSNTDVALTRTVPRESSSGDALYPDGVRSYLRLVTHDFAQGIAAAHLAKRQGARRAAVLHQDELDPQYVRWLTLPFVASARGLGIEVVQFEWPLRKSYASLAASVAEAQPAAVFLAGLTSGNAKRLIEDLRAALGPGVTLIAPDSFSAPDIGKELGAAGQGMLVTNPGFPAEELPAAGQRFLREFAPASTNPLYVPEAAQATEVLLDAIARSDGTRASVVDELFRTKVTNGILGSFSFDRYGDIVPAPVGIFRVEGRNLIPEDVIRAPLAELPG